jgi:hypothetical protein
VQQSAVGREAYGQALMADLQVRETEGNDCLGYGRNSDYEGAAWEHERLIY